MFRSRKRGENGNIDPDDIEGNRLEIISSRDNHICQICGRIAHRKDNVQLWDLLASGREKTLNNMVPACDKCFFTKEMEGVRQELREISKWNHIERGFSVAYTMFVLRDLKQKTRIFAHTGRFIFLRRCLVFLVGCLLTIFSLGLLAGIVGGLFISPQTGISWLLGTFDLAYGTGQVITETQWLIVLGVGIGYIAHTIEREWYHFTVRIPHAKFYGEEVDEFSLEYGLSRPTWQYLGLCSVVALVGGFDWILISMGVLDNLFGAGVFWIFGTVGSAYLVRPALRQDITEYGLRLRAGPWIAVLQYGAFLGGVGLLTSSGMSGLVADMPADLQLLLGFGGTLLPPVGDYVAVLLSGATGLAYVGRRYLELHSRQVSQVMHGLWRPRAVLETAYNESGSGILSAVKAIPSILNQPWGSHSNPYLGHEIESIEEGEDEQETDIGLDDVRTVFDNHDGVLSTSEVAEILGVSRHAAADRLEELKERGELSIPDDDRDGQDQNHDVGPQSESHGHTGITDSGRSSTRSNQPHDRVWPSEGTSAGDGQSPQTDNGTGEPRDCGRDSDTVDGSDTDGTRSQYAQNKELAFDRDDRICQLCGAVGYPKTHLGLVAVPASDGSSAGDASNEDEYGVENLVTICNTCAQNHDPEELQRQATQLKEWTNVDDFTGGAADTDDNYIIDGEDSES